MAHSPTLDSILEGYENVLHNLHHLFDQVVETGIIPNGDTPGAPQTKEEALIGFAGMMFVLDRVIADLNVVRMELNFAESAEESNEA